MSLSSGLSLSVKHQTYLNIKVAYVFEKENIKETGNRYME